MNIFFALWIVGIGPTVDPSSAAGAMWAPPQRTLQSTLERDAIFGVPQVSWCFMARALDRLGRIDVLSEFGVAGLNQPLAVEFTGFGAGDDDEPKRPRVVLGGPTPCVDCARISLTPTVVSEGLITYQWRRAGDAKPTTVSVKEGEATAIHSLFVPGPKSLTRVGNVIVLVRPFILTGPQDRPRVTQLLKAERAVLARSEAARQATAKRVIASGPLHFTYRHALWKRGEGPRPYLPGVMALPAQIQCGPRYVGVAPNPADD